MTCPYIAACLGLCLMLLVGCTRRHPAAPTTSASPAPAQVAPLYDSALDATPAPPAGWTALPIESDAQHTEKGWLSPSGDVSYGVIRLTLPFPAPGGLVIDGYVRDTRASEGTATLLSKTTEGTGTRFAVRGGKTNADVLLTLDGFKGWFVYVRTPAGKQAPAAEVDLAKRAARATKVGR